MKTLSVLVLCLALLSVVACADKTNEAANATSAIFDKASAEVGKATAALKGAKDAKAVAAAIDIATAAIGNMMKDAGTVNEKYKNARGSEEKALELIKPAQERFGKAQQEFMSAMGAIDTAIMQDEVVLNAIKKMQALKD